MTAGSESAAVPTSIWSRRACAPSSRACRWCAQPIPASLAARRDSDDGRVGRDCWSCLALSLFSEQPAQGFRLAVPPPSDVGDPPALLELDKVEHDGLGLVEILELDRSACLARRNVLRGDIECLDIPVAGIDEWIARKRGGLAAIRGILSVLDDE